MSNENANIYKKMMMISSEISNVAKNLEVGSGRSQYKAVGEADVLAAVKPIEYKYGVYSYPYKRSVINEDILTSTKTYNGQTSESRQLFMRIETVYRFVNVDKPEEFIDVTTYGDGVDSQDKACGKAMTYADKYALLKAYKIMTGDDPDQHMSEQLKGSRNYDNRGYNQYEAPIFNPRPVWAKLMMHFGYNDSLTDSEKDDVKRSAINYLNEKFGIDNGAKITEEMARTIEKEMGN